MPYCICLSYPRDSWFPLPLTSFVKGESYDFLEINIRKGMKKMGTGVQYGVGHKWRNRKCLKEKKLLKK